MTTVDGSLDGAKARSTGFTLATAPMIVAIAAATWAFGYVVLALTRYDEFRAGRVDHGFMVQAVWNTLHGRFLAGTSTGEETTRLAGHVDPILALLAPGALVVPTPELLVVVQALALASGAFPVFALARRKCDSDAAGVLLALAYLLNPWMAWQAYADFQPISLAVPLLLFAILFLDGRRYVAFGISGVLALMCGELVGLGFVGLGLWHGFTTRRWRAGVAIGALGAGWTAACLWIVIPAASGGHVSPFYGHFEGVGGSPSGVLRTAFTEPGALVDALTSWRDVGYVAAISAPLLGLFLASPVLALGAAPQLTINLLSGWPATTSANQHYTSAILPYLVAATILGIGRMSTSRGRLVASGAVLEVSVLLTIAFAPWPGLALDDRATLDRNERREALSRAVDLVPGDAAVAATNAVGAHLSERRYIYSVPALGRAEWVVIDRKDTYLPQYDDGRIKRFPERLAQFERRLRLSGNWRRIYTRDDVVVYRLMRPEAAA